MRGRPRKPGKPRNTGTSTEAAVGNAQSSTVTAYGRNDKKARNERSRKQRKKLQPVAVANGDAKTAVVVQAGETTAVGSDDESDGEEESTSCCRTVIAARQAAACGCGDGPHCLLGACCCAGSHRNMTIAV
jgi:hypothetical protein